MKKAMLFILSTGMFVLASNAQSVTTSPMPQMQSQPNRPDGIIKTLKDLGISDDQIQKCKAVMEDTKTKQDALKKDALPMDAKKAQMKEIMDNQQAKLKDILGEEKFNKAKELMGGARPNGGSVNPGQANNRLSAMITNMKSMGIPDDQILKCKTVMDDSKTKLEQVKNDATLPMDAKKVKSQEIISAQQTQLKEILGEEKFKQVRTAWDGMNKKEAPKN